jgi:N-acetylmuramate 1-kinase
LSDKVTLTPAQTAFVRGQVNNFSEKEWKISTAGQAGSQRLFIRIKEKKTPCRAYILVVWDGRDDDWKRFCATAEDLSPGIPFLPRIYASDSRNGLILEEDLGDRTLHSVASGTERDEKKIIDAYCRTLDALRAWQSLDAKASQTVASRVMDYDTFLWETEYFAKRCAVDFCNCGGALDDAWESERRALARAAASLQRTFMHRDFQSENILLTEKGVRFVDFQGARLGPPAYDLASLLYDPYVFFLTPERTGRLFEYYCSLDVRVKVNRHEFDICAAQRLMQACGAYGNLSIHKGKTRYREFMPVALDRLSNVLERLQEYPAIKKVVGSCREAVGKVNK